VRDTGEGIPFKIPVREDARVIVAGILFDLGGTLIQNKFTPPEIFKKILEKNGIHVSETDISKALVKTEEELTFTGSEKIPPQNFWNLWDTQVLNFLGVTNSNPELGSHINEEWIEMSQPDVFPDVLPILDFLKKKKNT